MAPSTRSTTRAIQAPINPNTSKARVAKTTTKAKQSGNKKAAALSIADRVAMSIKLKYTCPIEGVVKSIMLNYTRPRVTKIVLHYRGRAHRVSQTYVMSE